MDVKAKVSELINAATICPEAKAAAEAYLVAYGTAKQAAAAAALIAELKEDVGSVDSAIAFGKSDMGKQILGDGADGFVKAAEASKAAGGKYCVCPACQAGGELLDHANEL